MPLRVAVSLGTDHHYFPRLLEYLEEWVEAHPDTEIVVQHGHTRPAQVGANHRLLPASELRGVFAASDIVLAQVGPGTIADANRVGKRPIVVPRDPALREVVDGHQFAYGRFMESHGRVLLATSREQTHQLLSEVAENTSLGNYANAEDEHGLAAERLGEIVRNLHQCPTRPPLGSFLRRLGEMIRS